jgi:hypothetical protein
MARAAHTLGNLTSYSYHGTTKPSNPTAGDSYYDTLANQVLYYSQQGTWQPTSNFGVVSNGYSYTDIRDVNDRWESKYETEGRYIRKIIVLKQAGKITTEELFNMQLMLLSDDEENVNVVKSIIRNLEDSLINKSFIK